MVDTYGEVVLQSYWIQQHSSAAISPAEIRGSFIALLTGYTSKVLCMPSVHWYTVTLIQIYTDTVLLHVFCTHINNFYCRVDWIHQYIVAAHLLYIYV